MDQLLEAVDVRYLLLDNYKKMGLDENHLAALLLIDQLLHQGTMLVTADLLALKMSLPVEAIDAVLVDLLNHDLIEYDNSGNQMKTTLNPLKRKLYSEFQLSIVKRSEENAREDFANQVSNIYGLIEKEWGRTLTPLEFGRIREWISFGYTDQMIIDALHEAGAARKQSIRAIDKILLKRTARSDVAKEGYSAVSEQWEKDIDKTIEIAQTKWLDDDE
jgi:DNA replication protein